MAAGPTWCKNIESMETVTALDIVDILRSGWILQIFLGQGGASTGAKLSFPASRHRGGGWQCLGKR